MRSALYVILSIHACGKIICKCAFMCAPARKGLTPIIQTKPSTAAVIGCTDASAACATSQIGSCSSVFWCARCTQLNCLHRDAAESQH